MTKILIFLCSLAFFTTCCAEESQLDLKSFAQQYFDKMVATQLPAASQKELEDYLALLKDDVGHTHLPWVTDDSREPDGKDRMRKGMQFYLGAHSEYSASLLDVFVFNDSAIAIRYHHEAKGIHPENNQPVEYSEVVMELLEIEQGKVAVIRKYHE